MDNDLWSPDTIEGFGPWIKHNGVECPIEDHVVCNVLLAWEVRYREVLVDEKPANYWNWECEGAERIILYCVKL